MDRDKNYIPLSTSYARGEGLNSKLDTVSVILYPKYNGNLLISSKDVWTKPFSVSNLMKTGEKR